MSKIVDVRSGGGDFVILGKALVLPSSTTDGADLPLDGSIRFNPVSGAVEVYVEENWTPLGGDGTTSAHNHTTSQITGLTGLLAAKADTVHIHPFNEIPGLQAALDEKSATTHVHGISNIVNLQDTLDQLQTQITANTTGKSNVNHLHVVTNVTGLQEALDGKAPTTHFHQALEVVGLQARLDTNSRHQLTAFVGKPTASQRIMLCTSFRIDIPKDFAGSVFRSYVVPTAPVAVEVRQNDAVMGTITFQTNGSVTATTLSNTGLVMMPTDRLMLIFPAQVDATIDTIAFAFLGVKA